MLKFISGTLHKALSNNAAEKKYYFSVKYPEKLSYMVKLEIVAEIKSPEKVFHPFKSKYFGWIIYDWKHVQTNSLGRLKYC